MPLDVADNLLDPNTYGIAIFVDFTRFIFALP